MRKVLASVGLVGLVGGTAAGANGVAPQFAPTNVHEVRVHRYAFDAAGRSPAERAAEVCHGGQVGSVRTHRTAGDVAAMVFTAFWYTPEHATVECSSVSNAWR